LLALRSAPNHPNPIEGQAAVLLASLSYAFSVVFIRRNLRHVDPMVTAGVSLTSGALIANFLLLLTVRPLPNVAALQSGTVLAVVVLGLVNTFIAYLLFFNIIHAWGATRSTLVTYIAPPISLLLGAVTRSERIDAQLVAGAALIIAGVAFVNWPSLRKLFAGRTAQPAASPASPESAVSP
jgi:drug/metabolite transporter (DMT)-like permease